MTTSSAPARVANGSPTSYTLATLDFHPFEASGAKFLYMVPSAGVFRLEEAAADIIDLLGDGPLARSEVVNSLGDTHPPRLVEETIDELMEIRALGDPAAPTPPVPVDLPPADFPLTTLVLNVTNKCNLACTYCYEYGEDKIVDTRYGSQPQVHERGIRPATGSTSSLTRPRRRRSDTSRSSAVRPFSTSPFFNVRLPMRADGPPRRASGWNSA